jgi:hypothetical protein
MRRFQKITLMITAIWGLLNIIIIFQYPNFSVSLLRFTLLYLIYYAAISFYLATRPARYPDERAESSELSDEMGYDTFQSDNNY